MTPTAVYTKVPFSALKTRKNCDWRSVRYVDSAALGAELLTNETATQVMGQIESQRDVLRVTGENNDREKVENTLGRQKEEGGDGI